MSKPLLRVNAILGTNGFGKRMNLSESENVLKSFWDFTEKMQRSEIDTAYIYGNGESEKFIGQMALRLKDKMQIATKATSIPLFGNSLDVAGLRKQLETSLGRMNVNCVQIFYLHAPDSKIPIEETLSAVEELYQEKKFIEFGLSNYSSWQVAEICTICKMKGWIQPTVYQGMYNCLTRGVEKELLKCLKYFNIRFYAYNPLCGGILTGKHTLEDANRKEPGRFFGDNWHAKIYRDRYWKEGVFSAVEKIQTVLKEVYGDEVSLAEASFRWLYNHSELDGSRGDGVIVGSSSHEQLKMNLEHVCKGSLHKKVLQVLDECWNDCIATCCDYMR